RRLKEHRHERGDTVAASSAPTYVIEAPQNDDTAEIDSFTPVVIAESTTILKRLSVSEAVTELDMTGAPVMVFRHAANGEINVVYRRSDGHFGWIYPPASSPRQAPLRALPRSLWSAAFKHPPGTFG